MASTLKVDILQDSGGNNLVTSNGSGVITAAGFGKIGQVVQAETTTETLNTANSYATSTLSGTITPSSTSSKILVITSSSLRTFGDGTNSSGRNALAALFRGTVSGTKLQEHKVGLTDRSASTSNGTQAWNTVAFNYLDNPATNSAQIYTVGMSGSGSCEIQAQQTGYKSTMTLMEILP